MPKISDHSKVKKSKHENKLRNEKHSKSTIPLTDKPNIFKACNLEIKQNRHIIYNKKENKEKSGIIKVDNSIIPKLKDEFANSGEYKQPIGYKGGVFLSPDEILTSHFNFEPDELCYLSRDDIKKYTGVELPDESLLNAIHYYLVERVKNKLNLTDKELTEKYTNFMNETALLALGTIVREWIKDSMGNDSFKMYMEAYDPHDEDMGIDSDSEIEIIDDTEEEFNGSDFSSEESDEFAEVRTIQLD